MEAGVGQIGIEANGGVEWRGRAGESSSEEITGKLQGNQEGCWAFVFVLTQ